MMEFKGYGIVWDKAKDQVLCEFKDGKLRTDDKRVIKTLTEFGYEGTEVTPEAMQE